MIELFWSLALGLSSPSPTTSALSHADKLEAIARCTENTYCADLGMCTPAFDGSERCITSNEDECAFSSECWALGECEYDHVNQTCAILTPESCAMSTACRLFGLCHHETTPKKAELGSKAICRADDTSCRQSFYCKLKGNCSAVGEQDCAPKSESDCLESLNCKAFGTCRFVPRAKSEFGRCEKEPSAPSRNCSHLGFCHPIPHAASCMKSSVCKELGWCHPMRIQPGPGEPDHDYELPSFTACAALDCRESEVCRNFDACLAIDGACQVAPKREVTCKTKRILGLKAEATSTHPPEERDIFDATYAVDRDLRTAWAPEARDATTAILTIRLPKAERVARVLIKAGLWLDYAHMDWSAFFTQPYAILVRVGDRHEIAYAHWRWATDRWLEVTLPPTTSDTITLQTLFHGTPILSEAPAITDVKVEACE